MAIMRHKVHNTQCGNKLLSNWIHVSYKKNHKLLADRSVLVPFIQLIQNVRSQ